MKKKFLISIIILLSIITSIIGTVYATDENADYSNLPSSYDLRNDISIKVENQEDKPWCSAYSDTKMVETYLSKTKGLNYNLSEGYEESKVVFGSSSPYSCITSLVLESDYPNKIYSNTEENRKKFEEASNKAVVLKTESLRGLDEDSTKLKQYIMKYGATDLTTCLDKQWYNYKGGIYHKDNLQMESMLANGADGHAVAIIGWNDNYSKDNFKYEKPQNDGAWLILNSWGTDWGNNGTAWVSYEDKYIYWIDAINSVTLSNGEVIKTELPETEQERITREENERVEKERKEQAEQYQQEQQEKLKIEREEQKKRIITYLIIGGIAVVLLVILLGYSKKVTKDNKNKASNSKTKKIRNKIIIITLILLILTIIFML